MAGSETPVNLTNESSQHLKEDETPQSPVSEDWKWESIRMSEVPLALCESIDECYGIEELRIEDEEKKPKKLNYARFPVLDEDLIGERGRNVRRYGGGRRIRIDLTQSNIRRVPNYDTPASSTDHPNQMVPQFGVWADESEAGHDRWIGNVWKSIKNWVVKPMIVFKSLMYVCIVKFHGSR